jgi:hypothetical protein
MDCRLLGKKEEGGEGGRRGIWRSKRREGGKGGDTLFGGF